MVGYTSLSEASNLHLPSSLTVPVCTRMNTRVSGQAPELKATEVKIAEPNTGLPYRPSLVVVVSRVAHLELTTF